MAKKKSTSEAPAAEGQQQQEKLTQKQAVQRALDAGKDSPAEGVAYVKENFGIALSNQAFSTLKSQLKRASGQGGSGRRGRGASGGRPTSGAANGRANPADLARTLKQLMATYGAPAVSDMLAVLAE